MYCSYHQNYHPLFISQPHTLLFLLTQIHMASCPPFDFSGKYYQTSSDGCLRQTSFFAGKAVLNQGVGYSVILGFGAFFAFFTSFLVRTSVFSSLINYLLLVSVNVYWRRFGSRNVMLELVIRQSGSTRLEEMLKQDSLQVLLYLR